MRLVTAQGLLVTTDAQGRYHIVCPVLPDAALGSNFIVKLDERTLPSGYRLTTDNPDTVRLTAGKVSKLNFGATIHHVVRIELSDAAFEGNALRAETAQRIDALVAKLNDHACHPATRVHGAARTGRRYRRAPEGPRGRTSRRTGRPMQIRFPLRTEEEILRPAHVRAKPYGEAPAVPPPQARMSLLSRLSGVSWVSRVSRVLRVSVLSLCLASAWAAPGWAAPGVPPNTEQAKPDAPPSDVGIDRLITARAAIPETPPEITLQLLDTPHADQFRLGQR